MAAEKIRRSDVHAHKWQQHDSALNLHALITSTHSVQALTEQALGPRLCACLHRVLHTILLSPGLLI